MKLLMVTLLLSVSLLTPHAQAQSTLDPSLGLVFPVKLEGEKLRLPFSVLLNLNDIIPAGTSIHKVIQKPRQDDKDVKMRKNKDYNTDKYAAVQRFAIEHRENDPNKTAVMRAVEDRSKGDSMTDELKFRAFLHRSVIEEYYLAYDLPGGTERRIGQFEFPEGLFLSEQGGKVIVLAVGKDTLVEKNGVIAGSELKILNGSELKSLEDFRSRYFKEKKQRQEMGEIMSMSFKVAAQDQLKTINFSSGRSLRNTGDLMSDLTTELEAKPAQEKPTPTAKPPEPKMPIL